MKNKKYIYFLIPAALFIWGGIGYRIVKTINPSTPKNISVNAIGTFHPQTIQQLEPYTILANYRDPFLGTLTTGKPRLKKKKSKSKAKVLFPNIVYKGMIAPQNKNTSSVFLVQINGRQHLLKHNIEEVGVRVVSGNNKTVALEYKKQHQSFEIQN